jgi:hypothetical protein
MATSAPVHREEEGGGGRSEVYLPTLAADERVVRTVHRGGILRVATSSSQQPSPQPMLSSALGAVHYSAVHYSAVRCGAVRQAV